MDFIDESNYICVWCYSFNPELGLSFIELDISMHSQFVRTISTILCVLRLVVQLERWCPRTYRLPSVVILSQNGPQFEVKYL